VKKIKFVSIILLIIILIASLTACNAAKQYYYVFGTFLEVSAEGKKADKVVEDIYNYYADIEKIISATYEGSDIYKINHSNKDDVITCNKVTMDIIKKAKETYDLTNGAYDPSIYPLVRLFNFSSDLFSKVEKENPTVEQVNEVKECVGLTKCFKFDFENNTVQKLVDGAMLDLGGIAKGYCVDVARNDLSTKTLINLGGNISAKNKSYTVGISNPSREDRKEFNTSYFGTFKLEDGECIATSGDYERYYSINIDNQEKIYTHIISPYTYYPVETTNKGMAVSCSIIATDGALSDAIATAVIVLGIDEGIKLINSLNLKAVIIASNFDVYILGGLDFSLTDNSYNVIK